MINLIGGDDSFRLRLKKELEEMHCDLTASVIIDFVPRGAILASPVPRMLVRFEGPSSSPLSHCRNYEKHFSKVIDVGTSAELPWPLERVPSDSLSLSSARENKAVMVLANKLSLSKTQLYSLRRDLIKMKYAHLNYYGTGWDARCWQKVRIFSNVFLTHVLSQELSLSSVKSWFENKPESGKEITDKFDAYKRHTIAVVIENDNQKTTEKLFDAFISGCKVVYVGSRLDHVPSILLDRVVRADPSAAAIVKCIEYLRHEAFKLPNSRQWKAIVDYHNQSWSTLAQSISAMAKEISISS